MFLQDRKDVAVIVTNHNYLHFLADALSSIRDQILAPTEVVVVDDASDESCEDLVQHYGYQYIKTEYANPLLARRAGFEATKSEYVCFLDADDRLPSSYLAQAILAVNNGIDIAFSDIQHFGDRDDRIRYREDIPARRLWQVNFLHIGCVVSRIAVELSEAFLGHPNRQNYHEDWLFWRKVVRYGFKYAKHSVPYEVRVHSGNRSASIREGGYIAERAVRDLEEIWHFHTNKNSLDFLKFLNAAAKKSTGDYVCLSKHRSPMEFPTYDWHAMAMHLDHDVAVVHDSKYELFDHTLIVGPVFRDYVYTSLKLPFDAKTERVVII